MSLEVCIWIAVIGLVLYIGFSGDGHVSFDDSEGCLGFAIIAIIIAIVLYTCSN